ncbi:VOC family protein [Actinomadura spongiicola]|uniref:VOC family protein n=1 Tax=Actinomadura spongiicola TaxID=2303421 RepID=A0A372GPZ1_9ACTN|nr:VOC family protein [Actinomadura spongiicola]RFS87446.1 VOC family protein [Actinomadura spongiicola]
MTTLKPASMLLGTTRPAELRAWYIKALAPEFTGEGPIDLGGFLLVIDGREDVSAKNDQPGRTIINFDVDDFDAEQARLTTAGVEWISVEEREKGKFGTFADPDGNYLQIIEWRKDG